MSLSVRLPDGRTIQTNATTPQQAQQAARTFLAYEQQQKVMPKIGPMDVAADSATLGLDRPFNAAISAGVTGLGNLYKQATGKPVDVGMGDAFNASRRVQNDQYNQFAAQHPIASVGLGLLGGLATGPGLAKAVVGQAPAAINAAKGLLPRVAQIAAQTAPVAARSAAVGTGLGAVSGLATADPGGELAGATRGAVTGGLTGAAVPFAGRIASGAANSAPVRTVVRAASKASGALGGPTLNPQRQAGLRLMEAMQRDGATPDQVKSVANEWLAKGVTPTLIDAVNNNGGGQNTMALIRSAAMKSPGARNTMTQYDRQVGADLTPQAMQATAALTPGDTATAEQAIAARTNARSEAANTEYRAPYPQQIQTAPIIDAVSGNAGQRAIGMAAKDADTMRLYPQAQELSQLSEAAAIPPPVNPSASPMGSGEIPSQFSPQPVPGIGSNGQVPLPPQMSLGALDRTKIALNDMGADAMAANPPRAGAASGYFHRASQIDDHLAANSPEYATARDNYADRSKPIEAIQLGASGLQPGAVPADYADALSRLSVGSNGPLAAPVSAARTGLRSAAQQMIGNGKPGAVGPLSTLRNTNNRAILASTFGDDVAGHYDSVLDKLTQQRQNAASLNPNTGAPTAIRGTDALTDGLMSSNPKTDMIKAVIDGIRNGMTLTDPERDALAKMATMQAQPALSSLPTTPDPTPTISPALAQLLAPYAARQGAPAQ